MSADAVSAPAASSAAKTLGRVKWFNNKTGYGFITVIEGDEMDVFVHHSSVIVASQQYKYLVEGEYVHFVLSESTSEEHKHLATEVTGINGGKLMCETRNMHQETRRERGENDEEDNGSNRRTQGRRGGKGGRFVEYDGQVWMQVRNGRGGGGGGGGGRARGGGRGPRENNQEQSAPSAEDI